MRGAFFRQEVDRAPLFDYDSTKSKRFDQVLAETLVHAFTHAGYDEPARLADAVYAAIDRQLVVPTVGSPPGGWTAIGTFLPTTSGPGAAAIIEALGASPSVTFIGVLLGMTVLMNIAVGSRAIGRGLQYRIDQLLGTRHERQDGDDRESSS